MHVWTDAHLSPSLAPWLHATFGIEATPPQIVWLTCGNTSNAALRAILATAWPRVAELLIAGESLVEISGRAS